MVYLESIRYNQRASLRTIVSGQRVPMELTSLGRAYLAMQPKAEFHALMDAFKRRGRSGWERLAREITEAVEECIETAICVASWQPEVIALATPLAIPGHRLLSSTLASARRRQKTALCANWHRPCCVCATRSKPNAYASKIEACERIFHSRRSLIARAGMPSTTARPPRIETTATA